MPPPDDPPPYVPETPPPPPAPDAITWEPYTWYGITYACLTPGCVNENIVKDYSPFYSNNGDPKFCRVVDAADGACGKDCKILTATKLDPQPEVE
ncbi:hypothetical protein [Streptomyces olivaceiscleroticus]